MPGHAPILDFDGTIARLDLDWEALRYRFAVARIDDLWGGDPACWDVVTAAEVEAAGSAMPVGAVMTCLREVDAFAVLSNNSEAAIAHFMHRFPDVEARLALIVGRETLGGPKTDFDRFRRGLADCLAATRPQRSGGPELYFGDAAYELEFAAELGMVPVDVLELRRRDAAAGALDLEELHQR
ncbi:MAG TPA: hypothetical protein VHB02_07040 [Acidimicrobiales bacterium]|nr:hypothetical protein [Acidimicrobiales bacterium]